MSTFTRREVLCGLVSGSVVSAVRSGTAAEIDPAPPEVGGLLATRVAFEGDSRVQIAAAALDLLDKATFNVSASWEGWQEAQRGCHLHIKFPKATRQVSFDDADMMPVAEIIVTLPFTTSSGAIWVTSGDRYARFAKYATTGERKNREFVRLQELLREARVAE
jgi:hypothetical protein